MKKLLALMLSAVMVLSLVACSSDEGTAEGEGEGEELLSVYLVTSNLGDKSFNDSAHAGLTLAAEELAITYDYIEYGDDHSKVESTLMEAVESGYDVIVMNNLGFGIGGDWVLANAEMYPETTFLIYDESVIEFPMENVQALGFRANESDFLAGALAASISETGVISFMGGYSDPVINDFLVGYIQGALYVDPEIQIEISYSETYIDSPKGKELGNTAIAAGADVLHGVAGRTGNGTLEAAYEAGVWGIGVDSDQYELFKESNPELAASIVTSAMKDIGSVLYSQLEEILAGEYMGGATDWYGLAEGATGIAKNENYLAVVPAEVQAEIDAIEAMIASGEIVVESFYGMDEARFEELKAEVD